MPSHPHVGGHGETIADAKDGSGRIPQILKAVMECDDSGRFMSRSDSLARPLKRTINRRRAVSYAVAPALGLEVDNEPNGDKVDGI